MELVYCWGKNYASLSDIEINFNTKFSFQFDETNENLKFDEYEEAINVFSYAYHNIANVTALIGENGTGKTTFIHFLLDCFNVELSRGFGNVKFSYILIFYEKENFIIYDNLSENITVTSHLKYIFDIMPKEKSTSILSRPHPPMCVVHYTNAFSFSAYRDIFPYVVSSQLYDISLTKLLHEKEGNDPTKDPIMRAYHRVTKRQVAAWEKWKIKSFPRPELHIHMSTAGRGYYVIKEFIESNWTPKNEQNDSKTELLSVCKKIMEKHNFIGRGMAILQGVVYSLIQWMLSYKSWTIVERNMAIANIAKDWKSIWSDETCIRDANYILSFVKTTFRYFVGGEKVHDELIHCYKFVIDSLLNEEFFAYSEDMAIFRLRKKENSKFSLSAFYDNNLKAIAYSHDFIVFDWGMSTGEFARFDLFSHIVEMGEKANDVDINKRCSQNSFLFILDEIDLYLHPRWQQSFLNDLLIDLSTFFPNQTVQIVFATHSPIFLSDMLNDNVIYLEKGKASKSITSKNVKKTFATNIYNLYHDAFFLKDNLGFMGDFSYTMLNGIGKEWKKYLSNKEKILKDASIYKRVKNQWKIVDKVGEPILRTMFQKMYIELIKILSPNEKTPLTEYEMIIDSYISLSPEKREQIKNEIIQKRRL